MDYNLFDYDSLLSYTLEHGERTPNRTGIDCLTVFGTSSEYIISDSLPILTKRKYPYKSIIAELIWMLSGSTNIGDLEKLGSKIWTPWRSKEFEEKNGYADGEIGPSYGFQLINSGGDHSKPLAERGGFNQVQYVIDELKRDKFSRRIMIDLWDPQVMTNSKVRLPCCHFNFIINCDKQDRLHGMLTQRSGDVPLGCPANIFFYSLLLNMIAQQTGLKAYRLIHNIANCHIYANQLDQVKLYLEAPAYPTPKLKLKERSSIFDYIVDDIEIIGYESGPAIKIPVAV